MLLPLLLLSFNLVFQGKVYVTLLDTLWSKKGHSRPKDAAQNTEDKSAKSKWTRHFEQGVMASYTYRYRENLSKIWEFLHDPNPNPKLKQETLRNYNSHKLKLGINSPNSDCIILLVLLLLCGTWYMYSFGFGFLQWTWTALWSKWIVATTWCH